jgi:hypothetical protein
VKDLRGVGVAGDPVRGEERKLQEMLLGEEERGGVFVWGV